MEDLGASPKKRLKAPPPAQSPHPAGKGKRKMEDLGSGEDEDPAADGRVCGICFAEERRSIRGRIDCCDHYFCFVCIMEWAKIESRCPLCKQRFGSIRRPGVPGVFFRERIVRVPVRNQTQLFDDATTEDDDPYANISCSVCHNSTDDNLLLLCDLCDSSAHTYCIGLGFTVPEGDWYCPDCTVSRKDHSRMENDDYSSDELLYIASRNTTEADPLVSIFDIVHDEGSSNTLRESRAQALRKVVGDSRPTSEEGSPEREPRGGTMAGRRSLVQAGTGTLHQHRDRHLCIQLLRENWSKFQSGSMDFRSSSASACGASNGRERRVGHRHSIGNVEAATGFKPPEVNVCTGSHDVDRAWKMLEIAKSMRRVQPTASHQAEKFNGNDSMRASISHRRILPANRSPENRSLDVGAAGIGICISRTPFEVKRENFGSRSREKHGPDECGTKETMSNYGGVSSSSARSNSKRSLQFRREDRGHGSLQQASDASNSVRLEDVPGCFPAGTLYSATRKTVPVERGRGACGDPATMSNGAKSEIQSLVKLNLKSKSRHLGKDKFKEIARIATHTILAACRLDHSESSSRPISAPICLHRDESNQRPSLLPGSCTGCFSSFVKYVVDAVASERMAASGNGSNPA